LAAQPIPRLNKMQRQSKSSGKKSREISGIASHDPKAKDCFVLPIAVAVVLLRCPWYACMYLDINTYTIMTLDEYRWLYIEPNRF